MKEDGIIIWNVTAGCNMDCPYCFEGHDKPDHPEKELLEKRLDNLLQSIKGCWELRLNGGELFDMPGFLKFLVPAIMEKSTHKIAVLTNLTSPIGDIVRLSEMTKERLSFFSSSIHLTTRKKGSKEIIHTDPYEYLEKAKRVKEALGRNNPGVNYFVNCVLLPSNLELINQFKDEYGKAGIPLFFQFLKTGESPNLKPYVYNDEQLKIIEGIVGKESTKNELVNSAESFNGHNCYAGKRYFIINEDGLAYICHAAIGSDKHFLGNITKSAVKLLEKPVVCPYDLCTAGIPKIKGIVDH